MMIESLKKNFITIIVIILVILICVFIKQLQDQKAINNELLNKFALLNVKQNSIKTSQLEFADSINESIKNNHEEYLISIFNYNVCLQQYDLNTGKAILDAIKQLCAPIELDSSLQFSSKNNIFLECFINKSNVPGNALSVDEMQDECDEYEQTISEDIAVQIQQSNN